jgi:hypothetical protein
VLVMLAACAADPDVHVEVARMTNQQVTLQLCDPTSTAPCKTTELFGVAEAITATKTIDLFVDDATLRLALQFTLAAPNFCTQVGLELGAPIDARVVLPADSSSVAAIEHCEACTPEPCE